MGGNEIPKINEQQDPIEWKNWLEPWADDTDLSIFLINRTEDLVSRANNIDFEEWFPTEEGVIKALKDWNITTQTLSDLNYVLPNNILKQWAFIAKIILQVGTGVFSKLKSLLVMVLKESYEEDMKLAKKSPTWVSMMDTSYNGLYRAIFWEEFTYKK